MPGIFQMTLVLLVGILYHLGTNGNDEWKQLFLQTKLLFKNSINSITDGKFSTTVTSNVGSHSENSKVSGTSSAESSSFASSSSSTSSSSLPKHSDQQLKQKPPTIIHIDEIEPKTVNHEPYTNTKKVLIENGVVPLVTQFAVANFPPGGYFPSHSHKDMHEIFFVLNGTDNNDFPTKLYETHETNSTYPATKHALVYFPPNVTHAGRNEDRPQDGSSNWNFLVIGVKAPLPTIQSAATVVSVADVHQTPMKGNDKILKRNLISRGVIPGFLMVTECTLPKGEVLAAHKHDDAFEVYYVLSGSGSFVLGDQKVPVRPNQMVYVPPGTMHGPEADVDVELQLLYFMVLSE